MEEDKVTLPGFALCAFFGRDKPQVGNRIWRRKWKPAYFRLEWRVDDEDERELYDPDDPPRTGDITLLYFATSFKEWVDILDKFENNVISREEASKYIKEVKFKTFPEAFTVWNNLLDSFVRSEMTQAEVVTGMLKAAGEHADGGSR